MQGDRSRRWDIHVFTPTHLPSFTSYASPRSVSSLSTTAPAFSCASLPSPQQRSRLNSHNQSQQRCCAVASLATKSSGVERYFWQDLGGGDERSNVTVKRNLSSFTLYTTTSNVTSPFSQSTAPVSAFATPRSSSSQL